MDNNKKDPSAIVDEWMEDILKKMDDSNSEGGGTETELGADELAIAQAGLIHPDDMELERIVAETLAMDDEPTETPPADTEPEEDPNATRQFAAATSETPAQPVEPQHTPQEAAEEETAEETTEEEPAEETAEAAAEETEKEAVNDVRDRKQSPKKKKGEGLWGIPHLVSTLIWLMLIVAIGVSLGRTVWLCAADLLALGKETVVASVVVAEDDDISDVAQKLKDAGLIQYPNLFEFFTKLTGKGEHLLRGTISFNDTEDPNERIVYDYNALANALSYRSTARVTIDVMIPEGYNCAQIFALLEEKGVCSAASLEKYAAEGELQDRWFLTGVKRGHKYCLEGFLFPDTYEFYLNDEAGRVIEKLLSGFDYRFTDRMIDKMMALNNKLGLNMSIRDIVIMASIIEKEKASGSEGYSISSVFYNRLKNPGSYPCLQSDATIKYDVDFRSKGELVTDAQINASPYNTYTQKGLPAGPISNPGLSSLDAALDPEDTSYYFFIFDKNAGITRFSKTLSEHNEWARKLGLA